MIILITERWWSTPPSPAGIPTLSYQPPQLAGVRGTPRNILLNADIIRTIRPSPDGLGSVIELQDNKVIECTDLVEDLSRVLEAR